MKKVILTVCCILFSFCVFAQNDSVSVEGREMQIVKSISVEEFEELLIATKSEQLIDVRSPQEFERYRIPGAKNINIRDPEFREKIEQLDKDKPVLIYCIAGIRSKLAMEIFREAGFKIVYELNIGISHWFSTGRGIDQRDEW